MSNDVMTPREAAKYLGVNPQSIRDQAHRDPKAMGFDVSVIGTRVLIPRKSFFEFLRGAGNEGTEE